MRPKDIAILLSPIVLVIVAMVLIPMTLLPTESRIKAPVAPAAGGGGDAAAGPGDAERGKQVFAQYPCGGCHTLAAVPGAAGTTGPALNTVGTAAGQRKPGTAAEAYIRESILDPGAFTVTGYPAGLMPKLPLSEQQVNDLVALLLTQK